MLHRKVEIVTPESLNKFIGKYILKEVDYVAFAA
jgi:predicted nucleotidyltransferase